MDINHPESQTWRGPPAEPERRAPGLDLVDRFNLLDHQLALHLLAALVITATLIAVTVVMTAR
jgi:hypothetical protein